MKLRLFFALVFLIVQPQEGFSRDYAAQLGHNLRLRRVRRQSKPVKPALKVTDYHVRCSVVSRYAVTTVQSSIWNQLGVTKEAAFEVDLPSSAFISNFTITSNGKVYVAQVKERAAARKIYDDAKRQGKTAGLVATKEREIEKFRVAVSIPPGAHVSFSLSYEDLLPRRLGRYELSVALRPGQLVRNLTLEVTVTERTGISFVKVLPLKTNRLLSNSAQGDAGPPAATHVERTSCCARVRYSPSLQQQNAISSKGLNAEFVLQYDVDLKDLLGDVQAFDGYFVHYFAPRGLPVVPKDVIFVIDVSGSMIGTKMKQTKQAMSTILGDLREGDHFNIITFSDKVHTWRRGRTVRATRQNVRDAKDFVRKIMAEGWTNINAALLSAAQLVNPSSPDSSKKSASPRVPLVIFLTDGEATIGVTAGETIISNAKKALGSASLFGLAFGDDADFLLLKRLALYNRGVARMVYEDADAALQLKGFYDEVASPLLSDIQLTYLDDQAFDVTRSLFPNYFQGSELVVAGRVKPGVRDLKVTLSATDLKKNVKLENDVLVSENATAGLLDCSAGLEGISSFVHRLWAYFTIKELLLAKLNTTDAAAQRLLSEKATNLSLKYNFVTPVTSLVVVKPEEEEAQAMTAKPTVAATVTTPATTTTTKHPVAGAGKRPVPRPSKHRPDPPQPPPRVAVNRGKKPLSPLSTTKTTSSSKKTTTTSSPGSTRHPAATRSPPAPFSGKKPAAARNESKSAAPAPAGKISNSLKSVAPPAPGRVSTPALGTTKTTPPPTTTVSTATSSSSSAPALNPDPVTTPARPLAPPPSTDNPPIPPPEVENGTSPPDLPEITTPRLQPTLTTSPPAPAPAPGLEGNDVNLAVDPDVHVATLVSATFAPMPGVTDGPQLWEAAGLLDVSSSIQVQRKDSDATYDYDYNLNYGAWDDLTETSAPRSDDDCPSPQCLVLLEPSAQLSTEHFVSSVDGDPHFMVQLPNKHQNLCFTVDGRANDVVRLLEDPEKSIIVDGHLTGAPAKHGAENRPRTYFDRLTVSLGSGGVGGVTIILSLDGVVVEGEGRDTLAINQTASLTRQGATITVDNHRRCWIEPAKNVRFLVLFHRYKHPSYLQMAHLGFYIAHGRGLSASTQGLLGQFQHADMSVTEAEHRPGEGVHWEHGEGVLSLGILRRGSQLLPVTLQDKLLKDTVLRRHSDQCWVVPKARIQALLGHPYESYVVDRVKF